MNFKFLSAFFLIFLWGNCFSQPLPIDRFKKLKFEPVNPEISAALKIPFLDGQFYGLTDADGNILITPKFEDIEMPDRELPVFAAKLAEKWAFYDYNSRRALPILTDQKHQMEIRWQASGFRFLENMLHAKEMISGIQEPQQSNFRDPGGESKSGHRFYFLQPKTRPPFRSWFRPDHIHFIRSTRDRWVMGAFTSDFQHGNFKVMDENGRFGLLDRDGNLLQPPVRNCATIGSPEKIMILDDNDRIALRDARRGWQTDFLFNNIETTPEPGLFLGGFYEQGQPTRLFSIDSAGRVAPIEEMGQAEWLEKVPKNTKKHPDFQILWDTARAVLLDRLTGAELFRIEHGRVADAGAGFFEVQKGKKYGWLGSKGQVLMPIEFDRLIPIWQDRRMIGIKNGLAGLFDMETGQELLPVMFRNLSRGTRTFGHGAGFQIHHEKTWIAATKNLEIVGQKGPEALLKKSDFQLSSSAPAAARADYEKAELPEIFTDFTPIMGEKWLHIFRSDGAHITSLETGLAYVTVQFFSKNGYFMDASNEIFTGFAKVTPATGKAFWVRLSDGLVYKK